MRYPARCFLAALLSVAGCTTGNRDPGLGTQIPDTGRVAVAKSWLYYEAVGAGSPIVLLHSGYLDRRMWDDQFLAFGRTHRVVRYDARGYGRSGLADTPYSPREDLKALLDALHLTRVVLVGSSFGGATAIEFAAAYPDRVDKLVLVAPGLNGYAWPRAYLNEPWRIEARSDLARGDTVAAAIAWLHSDYLLPASEHAAVAAKLRAMLADNVAFFKILVQRHEGYDTAPDPPGIRHLAAVQAPTLLILGSRDVIDIHHIVDTLQARLSAARTVVFEGAGHLPNMEQPERFATTVLGFIDGQ